MIPDRIGIMGSTQGVSDSSRPIPKKVARTAARLPSRMRVASCSCSETNAPALAATTPAAEEGAAVEEVLAPEDALGSELLDAALEDAPVPAAGSTTLTVFVIGG